MASFDPSIISQIPDASGNPLEARAKGYKLADLITEQQRNKLLLGEQQKQAEDKQKATAVLQNFKGDIGTAEGNIKLAQAYKEAGLGSQAKEALQLGSEQQLQDLQKQKLQNEALQFAAEYVGPQALQAKKVLHEQGLAAAQQVYAQAIKSLPPQYQGKFPPQLPNDPMQADQLLDQAIGHSQKAQEMLQRQSQQANLADEARHRKVEERQGQERINLAKQKTETGKLDDEDVKFFANQYLAGDKSVFQNMGRGTQGAANIVAMRHAIREQAQAQGLSPQDVATKIAEFNGLMSEERALGTRQAAIETAATEAQKVVPIALKASEAVPRGSFVPLTKLIQKGQVMTSNPALARFAQANLTLANVYARAMSPTGVPTVSGRDHALEVLGTATSQEAYRGVVDIITQEIEAARTSPSQVRQDIRGSVKGDYQAPAPGPAAGSTGKTVNWADLK